MKERRKKERKKERKHRRMSNHRKGASTIPSSQATDPTIAHPRAACPKRSE
jgi:hypothetical protein